MQPNPPTYNPKPVEPQAQVEPGSKTLLMGDVGCGKTYSLRTLIDAGITPFIIATEPGIAASLGDVPKDKLHWKYIHPGTSGWSSLIDSATKINTMTYKALSNLEDINKRQYGQFIQVLNTMVNFVCDRTGESYGCVDNWSTDRALVLDSMSGISSMAMKLVVGTKPVRSQGDWGVAMNNLEELIEKLCTSVPCHFVLTSHMEREKDEVSGSVTLMPSTLGQKLSPKIPRNFDNVVECYQHSPGDFRWRTVSGQAKLKSRHLPLESGLAPTFTNIIQNWKSKGGVIIPTQS